ncbi:MAG: vWA domain-containing protein [Thermoguttaceae bacterium]
MNNKTDCDPDFSDRRLFRLPVWFCSVLVHLSLLLLFLYFVPLDPVIHGAPGDQSAQNVGIVLKTKSETGPVFVNQDETLTQDQQENSTETVPEQNPLTPTEQSPVNLKVQVLGPANEPVHSDWKESEQSTEKRTGNPTNPSNPASSKVTVRVFGLSGTGYRFAFVFDRSGSMGEFGGKPIQAAKSELLQAIDSLKSTHQMMILFYNHKSDLIFPNPKSANHLIYATDVNKELAVNFVGSIFPEGGTNHADALLRAARFKPDVIFLLTDGESKDDLNSGERDRVSRATAGIQINVIQFGIGANPPRTNYLKEIARSNGGAYQYIDIANLDERINE